MIEQKKKMRKDYEVTYIKDKDTMRENCLR